jgi:excisionase family DNA binding protein
MTTHLNAGRRHAPAHPLPNSQISAGGELIEENLPRVLNRILTTLEEIRSTLSGLTKPLYTVEEVADLVGRSPYTVRRWIQEGQIRGQRISGCGPRGRLLIAREELTRLVSRGLGSEMAGVVTAGTDTNRP